MLVVIFHMLLLITPTKEQSFKHDVKTDFYKYEGNVKLNIHSAVLEQEHWKSISNTIYHDGFNEVEWYKLSVTSEWEGECLLYLDNVLFDKLIVYEVSNQFSEYNFYDLSRYNQLDNFENGGLKQLIFLAKGEKKNIFFKVRSKGFPTYTRLELLTGNMYSKLHNDTHLFQIFARIIIFCFLVFAVLIGVITRFNVFRYYILNTLSSFFLVEAEYGFIVQLVGNQNESYIRLFQLCCMHIFILSYVLFYYKGINNRKTLHKNLSGLTNTAHTFFLASMFVFISGIFTQYTNRFFLVFLGLSYIIVLCLNLYFNYSAYLKKKDIAGISLLINCINLILLVGQMFVLKEYSTSTFTQQTNIYLLVITNTACCFLLLLYYTINIHNKRSQLEVEEHQLLQKYSNEVILGQEKERIRIGRELHDFVGGNLSLVNKTQNLKVDAIKNILINTARNVEELKLGLLEEFDNKVSNKTLFLNLVEKFHSDKMNCFIQFDGDEFDLVSKEMINHLYRITQELMNNALKHSESTLTILAFVIDTKKNTLYFHYNDNGKGFKVSKSLKGMGIKNIQYRVKEMGGNLSINSNNGGTTIVISDLLL
ncbi:sensor histidine kinase [Flammeovirga pacifica]|uniref:histidine kinase n=1 Tax=Flammeovirga pacifica TaxID=915059 RepID=A0A1S1YTP2_FLAPC|nr:ATP-binding protein [Flammeovirga pacifica]OHX64376.1 hypothetical protein NH26_22550 [Flammeovirga pacifica]